MRPRVSRLRPPRVVAAGLLRTTPTLLKTMNIHHLIGEILEELKTLREENALLGHEVAALHAKLALVEHKVDSVAEEMGMI